AQRVMRAEPERKTTELVADPLQTTCILDCSVYFQTVADDARVREQTCAIPLAVGSDDVDVEAVVSLVESLSLVEDRQPGEPGLIDLQHESLEQLGVRLELQSISVVVIGTVLWVTRCCATTSHRLYRCRLVPAS